MIPIYAICGVAYGMVELIRRIIPRDIVGGNVQKLRRMDSVVSWRLGNIYCTESSRTVTNN